MTGTTVALAANLERPVEQENSVQVTVARPTVNLRSGPGTTFAVVGSAKQGQKFTANGRNTAGDWYNITLEDGNEAWISAPLVQVDGDATSLAIVQVQASSPAAAPSATAQAQASSPAAAPSASVRTGELSGRLLYSMANMDVKRWELWEYNFANGENKKVADWRTELDVSADGKQIAYFAWPPDASEKAGIWIMDADFSNARLVVRGGAYPSFSPGGDRLVANGGDILYVFKTDGKDIRGLTKGEYPAWSPVSNEIVHRACVGGSCGLWIINADSKDAGARRHITTGGSDGQPAWGPDGKRIAYISKEDGNFEIYVIGSDGSNKVRLTSDPASDGLPVWSPDGRW
ncbi:MAG TPA: SH3 domain-containing protein, partial [Caldilineaceae bacterium]|nr:SH3 domain-containing protein [Caldilineaceae bacterium]